MTGVCKVNSVFLDKMDPAQKLWYIREILRGEMVQITIDEIPFEAPFFNGRLFCLTERIQGARLLNILAGAEFAPVRGEESPKPLEPADLDAALQECKKYLKEMRQEYIEK